MAVPRHLLYSFRGHFGDSAGQQLDEWSCGIRVSREAALRPDTDASQDLAADAAKDWKTFHSTSFMPIGQNTWFDYVRLYTIGTNGIAEGEIFEAEPEGGSTQGTANPLLPFQCATVVTLDTQSRSRPRYGRFFVPTTAGATGASGKMEKTLQSTLIESAKKLIDGLNNRPGGDGLLAHQVSVVSSVGEGAIKPVRLVRVGDVVDTMRSRRNKLQESYATRDITS